MIGRHILIIGNQTHFGFQETQIDNCKSNQKPILNLGDSTSHDTRIEPLHEKKEGRVRKLQLL